MKTEGKLVKANEHRTGLGSPLIFFVLAAGIGTAALGALALLGWVLGWPLLASFGADLIPMAPSTAVLFLLYGVAVSLRARRSLSGRAFQFSVMAGFMGMLVALLLFVLSYLDIQWSGEHLGLNITGTFQGSRLGHMSPVTALVFLCAGLSFLTSLSRSAIRPWRAALALGSAVVVLATSFIFLLAYLFGAPLLYGGTYIPPALNTILAFTMLGLSLLTLAGRSAVGLGKLRGADSRTGFALLLIFLLLAMGIIAAGYINYRHYEKRFRTKVEDQLSAIADLKVGELVQWRKDRLDDAAIFFKNPSFSIMVRRFFGRPADAQQQLFDWLGKYSKLDDYDQVRLMDAQSVTRLSIPAGLNPARSNMVRAASEVLRTGQVTLLDFYRDKDDQSVRLAVLVPIFDEADSSRPLGVLVLRIDPAIYLYPFIKRWPTADRTTETLLVRREGQEVVFLNELRFQPNTALNLRSPLDSVALPAAQAALGREGIIDGIDYRGVPVMAALRTIPDSPWSLVARMDSAEVYAPMRKQLWQAAIMVGFLLLGAGACVGFVWRQQRVRFYEDRAAAVEVLLASELRYRRLFESAKDGVLILDAVTGMVVDVNPFLVQLLGFSREEFLGKAIWELGFFRDIVANKESFAELQQQKYIRYEDKPLQTADGRRVDVEFVSNVYLVDHQKVIQCNIRDITERKRTASLLREKETNFRLLAENISDVFWLSAPTLDRIIYISPAYERVWGRTCESLYQRPQSFVEAIHPEDQSRFIAALEEHTQGQIEYRIIRPDGAVRWILDRGYPVRDEHGELVRMCGVARDITERKQAEEMLLASEKEFRSLAESMPQIVWITRPDGSNIYFNQQWVDYTGLTLEQSYGDGWNAPFHPDDKQRAWAAWQRATQHSDAYSVECRLRRADGAYRWWLIRGVPLRNENGEILKWFGTCTDIDDIKRAEQDLREAKALFEAVVENIPFMLFLKEATDLRFVMFNRAGEELLGYDRNALLGKNNLDLFPPEQAAHFMAKDREVLDGKTGVLDIPEEPILTAKKGLRLLHTRKACIRGSDGKTKFLLGISEDITERKQAEAQREQMQAQMLQSQKLESIGTLAGGVAHEINNPIMGIMNYAQLIVDQLDPDSPVTEYATEIGKETQRVATIVKNLLSFARQDKETQRSPAGLCDIVEDTLSLIRAVMRHDQITLEVKVPADLPKILCRSQQIRQVIMNLLTNARDALNEKYPGHDENKKVIISAREVVIGDQPSATNGEVAGKRGLRLTVEDHGTGIPEELRERIFNPFFSTKEHHKGTGLGLYISHGIVTDHGGTLSVESEIGQWTRFHVDLPAMPAEVPQAQTPARNAVA